MVRLARIWLDVWFTCSLPLQVLGFFGCKWIGFLERIWKATLFHMYTFSPIHRRRQHLPHWQIRRVNRRLPNTNLHFVSEMIRDTNDIPMLWGKHSSDWFFALDGMINKIVIFDNLFRVNDNAIINLNLLHSNKCHWLIIHLHGYLIDDWFSSINYTRYKSQWLQRLDSMTNHFNLCFQWLSRKNI